jgi:hypothetical protein
MSIELSDITPYIPLIGQALPTLIGAIESAIAAHKSGDPNAALAGLEAAIADVTPVVTGMRDELAKADASVDAYEAAKFPASMPLAATAAVVVSQLKMRLASLPAPELIHDTAPVVPPSEDK